MALLALVVASAGLLVSLLTYFHSKRRDFPRAKLQIVWGTDERGVSATAHNVGAGVATRIESKAWHPSSGTWRDLGPWATDIQPGEDFSFVHFAENDTHKRVQLAWYDAARPDVRREVESTWRP